MSDIDSLQTKEFTRLQKIGDFKGIILLEKKLIKRSEELRYKKGEIRGYLNLANSLCALNKNRESLYFLEIADNKLDVYNDDALKIRLHLVYGKNYSALGFYKQSNTIFDKAARLADRISNVEERKKRLYIIYIWKRKNFDKMHIIDSVFKMENKSLLLSPNPELFAIIAKRNLHSKKIDSAEYYLNKANILVFANKATIEGKISVLQAFGELCIAKKEYQKALDYLFKSQALIQKMGNKKKELEVYKLISEAYKNLNEVKKENEYLAKYSILNDSINQAEKNVLNIPVEKFLSEQAEKDKKNKKSLYYLIIGVILTVIAIIITLLNIYRKRQRHIDILIDQKEKQTDILKKKLDTAYEEVTQLAVNADPLFITRFKEVYSEFYNNLSLRYPNLTPNDVKFCALVKLNFSNKEIAQYDNMSIRTVESKKYRLRKKMGLDSDVDFNSWIALL